MEWSALGPQLLDATGQTLYMVSVTLVLAGLIGLAVGMGLYVTRRGSILENGPLFTALNLLVNFVRPIPFIILLAALGQVTESVVGTRLGPNAAIFTMTIGNGFCRVARRETTICSIPKVHGLYRVYHEQANAASAASPKLSLDRKSVV